jgi:hypothetical protein
VFEVLASAYNPVRFVPHDIFGIGLGDDCGPTGRVGFVEDVEKVASHEVGGGSGHGESIRAR